MTFLPLAEYNPTSQLFTLLSFQALPRSLLPVSQGHLTSNSRWMKTSLSQPCHGSCPAPCTPPPSPPPPPPRSLFHCLAPAASHLDCRKPDVMMWCLISPLLSSPIRLVIFMTSVSFPFHTHYRRLHWAAHLLLSKVAGIEAGIEGTDEISWMNEWMNGLVSMLHCRSTGGHWRNTSSSWVETYHSKLLKT